MDQPIVLNWTGILVATLAYFFFGFLWYTPLFGKIWAKEMGMSMDQKPEMKVMMKGLIINVIGCFLLAFVMTHDLQAWNYVPGPEMAEMTASHKAFMGAFFTWLGFMLPSDLNAIAWEGKSVKLLLINTLYHLIGLIIVGQILVAL